MVGFDKSALCLKNILFKNCFFSLAILAGGTLLFKLSTSEGTCEGLFYDSDSIFLIYDNLTLFYQIKI